MLKSKLTRPTLIMLLGLPGSGKTYISRQLSELLGVAHVSSDRIRDTLFDQPTYDRQEQQIVLQMMLMMTEQYIEMGMSVVFDISLNRIGERRALREISKKHNLKPLLIWLQIDQQTALLRSKVKDKRRAEDRFTAPMNDQQFDAFLASFQPPQAEDYIVVSGKHTFDSQKATIVRHLREMGLIDDETMRPHVAKPELMNLAAQARAQAGRVDMTRRNITIH